jgi:predicted N-acyltransferase
MSKLYGLFPSLSYPGTIVELPGATMEDYIQSLKGSHRHNLKKKLKKSKEKVKLERIVLQNPDQAQLDEIFALFWQTYEKGETKFERLTPQFFSSIARKPNSWFVLLRESATGKLVAFMLCFKLKDRVINKFIGIDYTRPSDWFLYFRLWEASVEWVIQTGSKEFQSGQTGYRGKIDVGHKLVPLLNYCRNRSPLFQELYRRVGPTITWGELDRDLDTFIKAHPEQEFHLRWKV